MNQYNKEIVMENCNGTKVTAFGHRLNTQSALIDYAVMDGCKTEREFVDYLKQHKFKHILEAQRQNPRAGDGHMFDVKILPHLKWLAGYNDQSQKGGVKKMLQSAYGKQWQLHHEKITKIVKEIVSNI